VSAVTVVDYGAGNLRSLRAALERLGTDVRVTADPGDVDDAQTVIVPGVGAAGPAMRRLEATGLADAIRIAAGRGASVIGICLGLQLFFATSEEAPDARGLGILPGTVRRFVTSLHVPHVGWARVDLTDEGRRHPMLAPAFGSEAPFFYHVHSYHPADVPADAVLATGEYGEAFPTLVGRDNVVGAQFHPEKSQRAGIELLDAFARWQP
jgi:glutamine amidotransferase